MGCFDKVKMETFLKHFQSQYQLSQLIFTANVSDRKMFSNNVRDSVL